MKPKYILYTLLVIGLGALVFYRIKKSASPEEGGGKGRGGSVGGAVVQVNGIVVVPREFADALSITGTLEAEQEVKIISQTAGLVTKVFFREGTNVKQGQVLLTIDDTELRATLAQTTTNQGLASETEKRAALLIKSGAISQQEYDAAKASLKSMQAQTQLVNAQIAKTQIRAPFSGRIGLTTVTVGKYVGSTDEIATLVKLNPIKVTFTIPEKYANRITVNSDLKFKVSASEKTYHAKVFAVEPAVDQSTRTLQLKARTENVDGILLPGAFAEIELPISTIKDALLVPSEAIVPVQSGQKLFIVENGKAKEVKVEATTRTDKEILVTSGLKAGDTVITTGNMSLKGGTKVKVKLISAPNRP
jgi:membrane fusion protein (multidrug efflux system)